MMKKKIMSILLALVMVIGMLPTVVFAAEDDPEIYVGGVGMVSGDYLHEGATAVSTAAPTDSSVGYAYYNDGVLTLKNYDYSGKGIYNVYGEDVWNGIIHTGNLDIILLGENTIELTVVDWYSYGITVQGDLTVDKTSTGSLTIKDAASDGIRCVGGDITIEGGTLDIAADCFGIYASGKLTINGGNLTVKSTNFARDEDYCALYSNTNTITIDDDLTVQASASYGGSNPETYDESKNSTYDWVKIGTAPVTYTVTFDANGGTVSPANATTGTDGKLTSLPTPTREGYAFDGWFTAAEGGTEVTLDKVYTANAKIYAQWTEENVPAKTPVTSISVTGVETPSVGMKNWEARDAIVVSSTPADALTAYPEDNFMVCDTNSPDWDDWTAMGMGDAFEAGKYYAFVCTVEAEEGYAFSESVAGQVNGNASDSRFGTVFQSESEARVYYVWGPLVAPEIYVGGKGLVSGQYLDEAGNVGTEELTDNYAYYNNRVLTLKNYNYSGAGIKDAAIYYTVGLDIVLIGENELENTSSDGNGITVSNGYLKMYGSDTDDKLTVIVNGMGIDAETSVIIENCSVDFTTKKQGIYSHDSAVSISGADVKISASDNGIRANNKFTIADSTVNIDATKNGIYVSTGNQSNTVSKSTLTIESDQNGINANYDVAFTDTDLTIDAQEYGICVRNGDVKVTNSNVEIKSTATESEGEVWAVMMNEEFIVDEDLTIQASTEPDGSLGEYVASAHNTYDYIKITAPTPEVWVGGVGMFDGDYLAKGASATTTTAPSDNYAYYEDGVLTLKNYDYTGAGAEIGGAYFLIARVNPEDYFEGLDLQIIYEGTNELTGDVEDEESDCAGIYASGGLTLTAKDESASLEVTAEAGLRAQKDDVVISGGTVIVTSTDGSAIVAYNDLTITDSTVTANADGTYALKAGINLTITDSTVTAVAKEYALHTKNVAFSGNSYVDAKITYNPGSFWAIRYDHVYSAGTFTYDGLNIQAAYKLDEELGTFQLGENQKYARVVIKPAAPVPVVNSIHIEGIVDLTSGQTVNDWYDAINDALADGSLTINDNTYDDETFFFGDVILIDGGLLDASKQSLAGDAVIGPGTYYFAICLGAADFADPLSVTAEGYGNDAVSFDKLGVNNGYEQIIVYVKMVVVEDNEPTPEIWVGGKGMVSGQYLDESGNVSTTALTDNYAYYKDGVLTLHNYDYSGAPEVDIDGSTDYCAVYRDGDLKVVLDGENSLTLTAEDLNNSAGIFADNLTVEKGSGSGKLTISGAGFGIFGNAVTINSGTFDIDVNYAAIIAMQNITIKNGDYDLTAESWGCIYSYDGIVTIENGNLVLVSENGYGIHSSTDSVNVKNGTLEIDASTGIESADILIEGGTLTITAEYGMEVYSEEDQPTSITIKGGNLDVTAEAELSGDRY